MPANLLTASVHGGMHADDKFAEPASGGTMLSDEGNGGVAQRLRAVEADLIRLRGEIQGARYVARDDLQDRLTLITQSFEKSLLYVKEDVSARDKAQNERMDRLESSFEKRQARTDGTVTRLLFAIGGALIVATASLATALIQIMSRPAPGVP